MLLQARGLGKRFGSAWIFRNIEIDLEPGEKLAVIGKNGSGKSTLLKVLSGLLSPTEGSVQSESLGYSALDLNLYSTYTAIEHLELAAKLRGYAADCDELLNRVGLAYAANKAAGEMSTGMRARLKMALALQGNPKLLLLDEPGASLDTEGTDLVASLLCDPGLTIIFATNDASERRFGTLALELG